MPDPRPMIAKLWRSLDAHPLRWVLAIGALFTLALVNVKLFAAGGPWWRGWADQKAYLESARAFLALDLDPERHWYPFVYSLTAAPFAGVLPAPFVPANITCFALAFAGFRRVAARYGVGGAGAVLLFLATTLLDPRIGKLWVEPWTTTLSAALVWLGLGITADLLFGERVGSRRAALLGVLLMLVPLVRPADLVVSAVVGLFALWRMDWRERAASGAGAGAVFLLWLALYLAIYGWRWSDYVLLSREYGLNFADLGWKTVVLLLDPGAWFPGETGLLGAMPWLLLAAAGWLLGLLTLRGPQLLLWTCLGIVALTYATVLFAYVDLLPSGMWRFNNVHYFKWLLPMTGLFALHLLRAGGQHRRETAAIVALLLLATTIRIDAVPVKPDAPARAVRFAAEPQRWADTYMARSVLADRVGTQRNFFDYHQIPEPGGGSVLAVALKRPFAGDELWIGNPAPGSARWPRRSPGQAAVLAGEWPRRPAERLGARVTVGLPCWLFACRQALAE